MKTIWRAIKFWFWWHFRATEMEKMSYDLYTKGVAIKKIYNQALDNRAMRISPAKFFVDEGIKEITKL